jgi:4'-phosphopantetheinyl transferase
MPDAGQIAQRFFAKGENEVFQTIPAAHRDEAFFNCWTRKEAFIKAIGEGLSHPLDSFEVSLRPGEPAALREVRGEGVAERQNWSLWAFKPGAEYVAALAVRAARAAEWQLSFWVA